jgi:hypothetical protein
MYRSMVQPVRVSRACGMASSAMASSASERITRMAHGPCFSDRTGIKAALGCNNGWWRGHPRIGGSGPALRGQSHRGPRHGKKRGSRTTRPCRASPVHSSGVGGGPRLPGGGSSGRCHGALWGQQKSAAGVGACARAPHGTGLRLWLEGASGAQLFGTQSLMAAVWYHALIYRRGPLVVLLILTSISWGNNLRHRAKANIPPGGHGSNAWDGSPAGFLNPSGGMRLWLGYTSIALPMDELSE